MSQASARSVPGSCRPSQVLVLLVAVLTGLVSLQTLGAQNARAAEPVPQMYQGPVFADAGPAPTEDKPQSKLWFNDGAWWALMRTSGNGPDGNPDVTIHRLMPNHTWQDTGTVVDGRAASTGDALWEGGTLVVASRVTSGTIQAARLTYDTGSDSYTMSAGFPKSVTSGSVESVTVARDSLSRLWVTYTDNDQVWVAHSTTNDTTWTAPFVVPVPDSQIASDDISAIVSFGGKVGVMWSDQDSQVIRFAVHPDTAADNTGWTMETALSGTRSADDHLNLKSLVEDDQGRVYAAIKTSLGDSSSDSSSDPSIRVLSRSSSGTWTATTAATVGEGLTRPQLALDATNRRLYVVMSTESGGNVYYRHSPLGASMSFTTRATLLSWPGAPLNDASTAKAPVTAASGLVVLASDDDETDRYYHAELALDGSVADTTPPTAPTGVTAVADTSSQVTVSWGAATDNVGVATYRVTRNGTVVSATVTGATSFVDTTVAAGTAYRYTVSAVDAAGNRSAESAAASVTTPAAPVGVPVAAFTATPAGGVAPVEVAFADGSTGGPTSWAWDFGDGSTATVQNPVHTFAAAGSFVVTLTASNGSGASAPVTRTVTVTEPAPLPGGAVTAGASTQAVSTANTTAVTIGKPAGVATGDVLIAQFTADGAPSVAAPPAGWSEVIAPLALSSAARVFVYYHVVADAAAEPASYTWQLSTARKWNAVMAAFRGVNTINPFDSAAATRVNGSTSRSVTVPGVTTTAPGAMLVGGVGIDSAATTVTPGTGWTEAAESSGAQTTELAHQARPTAGAGGTVTFTLSASQRAGGWQRALRPAG